VKKRSSGALPRRKWGRAIVASVAAVVLIYLIFRINAAYINPAAALALPPVDPAPAARAIVFTAGDPRQRVNPQSLELGRRTALAAPLAFEPFFMEAKAEEQAGRIQAAIRLMEEARRRRPSFDLARLHLISYYQQAGRFEDLLKEIDFLLTRRPETGQIILPELAKLMTDPRGRTALAMMLAQNPKWRPEFFERATLQRGRSADALDLLNRLRSLRPQAELSLERELYLQRLVQEGQHQQARGLWLETLPAGQRSSHALLFNGDFRLRGASRPFGWTVYDKSQGRAEIIHDGPEGSYLNVNYFGGSPVMLAEQQLALRPGRYRISQLVRGEIPPDSGDVHWRISCFPGGAELVRLAASQLQPRFVRKATEFTVAGNCPGQQLALFGEPGDISAEIRLQIGRVEILRVD
jgi:tetratricopeptide (TPR) repeat protein